jgi:hypothetical protein
VQVLVVLVLRVTLLTRVGRLASLGRVSHGGLTLREATRDSTWAEIAAVGEVLEAHGLRLRVVATVGAAAGVEG